jgi:hypothetical protein
MVNLVGGFNAAVAFGKAILFLLTFLISWRMPCIFFLKRPLMRV